MADQKRWFKVWTSILLDPDYANLPLEDIGLWARLGALTVQVGEGGQLKIPSPAIGLCALLGVSDVGVLKMRISVLPHVRIEEGKTRHDEFTVTFENWIKYQVDSTQAERARASRSKRRGEESKKRAEEIPPLIPPTAEKRQLPLARAKGLPPRRRRDAEDPAFARFYDAYPRHEARQAACKAWTQLAPTPADVDQIMAALAAHKARWERVGQPRDRVPHPATWLHGKRWHDELPPVEPQLAFDSPAVNPYAEWPRV